MKNLVLIPGLLCNSRLWSAQIAALAAHAEIYVPEIVGQTTIAQMASGVLDSIRGRFSLAGFSLGSQVALQIMELAADRIDRLALLSATQGGLLPPVQEAFRNAMLAIERGGFAEYLESAYPTYVTSRHAQDSDMRQFFMDMAYEVGPQSGLLQMKALLDLKEPFRHLGQITCPTIIIGGSEDRRTKPAAHETLAREIPHASLLFIEHAAHFTPLEQPAQVTAALRRWMESVSAT
ncbi:MAG TPA: alpha/beta hydrolase [Acidobacteriaceae bacterium]|jgi:pimeloyl-ACP methyl ester carboxylesterase